MSSINYKNTIIYRIVCGEKTIYGHTTNLQKLKNTVKNDCKNGIKTKLSTFIMENGGYDNCEWYMLENYTDCNNILDAKNRVEHHKTLENAVMYKMSKMSKMMSKMSKKSDTDEKTLNTTAKPEQKYECPSCKKEFARKFNMERHMNTNCKKKNLNSTSITLPETSVVPHTQNNTNNIQTQNIIQTQNNTNIQNNIVIEIGKENISNLLSIKQKKFIVSKMHKSIEYLVEHIHCNPKYPQFNNVQITSLSKPYCKTYSEKHKKYITSKTKDVIENMVAHRADDIETFLIEISESGENVSHNIESAIKDMVEKMENDASYKRNKLDKIRYAIYSYKMGSVSSAS